MLTLLLLLLLLLLMLLLLIMLLPLLHPMLLVIRRYPSHYHRLPLFLLLHARCVRARLSGGCFRPYGHR
jgi:hypothetical protein